MKFSRHLLTVFLLLLTTSFQFTFANDGIQPQSVEVNVTGEASSQEPDLEKIPAGENFRQKNLVAWCIVPFDAKERGPEERAKMVCELGLRRVAYDWRNKHKEEFEQEILAYKKNGIEYFAFWKWDEAMKPLIQKHGIKPQIWQNFRGKAPVGTEQEKLDQMMAQLGPIAKEANELGLAFGIYNHGGWQGEPDSMVKFCKQMREKAGLSNVGIVYNFHHAHTHMDGFDAKFRMMLPYLLCVNLNGMADANAVNEKTKENKIVPIGSGKHERQLIKAIIDAGYTGPIGVLGHRMEMDAKEAVQLNLDGLQEIVEPKKEHAIEPLFCSPPVALMKSPRNWSALPTRCVPRISHHLVGRNEQTPPQPTTRGELILDDDGLLARGGKQTIELGNAIKLRAAAGQ